MLGPTRVYAPISDGGGGVFLGPLKHHRYVPLLEKERGVTWSANITRVSILIREMGRGKG